MWTFEHFEGKKTHWHVSKNKNSFFTQEWFKLGLDCHATGLCTLDLFNLYQSVRYVDMMVQHAWWIMSKTTNTEYNFALTMEIHVQSSKTCGTPLEGAITLSPYEEASWPLQPWSTITCFALVWPNSTVSVPH